MVQAQLFEMCKAKVHRATWQQCQSHVDYGDDPLGDSPLSDAIFRGTEGECCWNAPPTSPPSDTWERGKEEGGGGEWEGESTWLAKFVCACFCSLKSALTPGWSLSNLQQERDGIHNIITAQRLAWHSYGSMVAFKLDSHSSFEAQRFRTIAI